MRKRAMFMAVTGSCCAMFGASGSDGGRIAASPEKMLVVYYSWGGNTRAAAKAIAEAAGCGVFELKPKQAYPGDYRACVDQARRECPAGSTPELSAMPDVAKYEVIFAGSPNWCGTMAPPLRTFLSSPALAGKTIVPFFTHGGGGMQNCERDVRALCGKSKVLKADTFYGSTVNMMRGKFKDFVIERIAIVK